MKEGTPKAIYLKDYKKPDYYVEQVHLDIKIHDGHTIVDSKIDFIINEEVAGSDPKLVLDGELLKLKSIAIDGQKLSEDAYEVFEEKLEIKKVPHKFTCEITVEIDPDNNKALEGLYKSGDIYCTQMESQGFRKLTYYLDRPDVLAKFTTRVEANKKQFPILLSNGNKIDSGELDGGRHFTIWEDPFKKPAYLFAVVAGDLGLVKGTYKTISGREVALEIYVDKGNEDKCDWAMRSLKESMRWDEQRFDLEYDLDIYMIVAVDAFNMGAMENKGLNIFNSHYVLAKKETATDSDFIGVEAVIGHEYFHNWTGNRVTCRDWFQLTLKEGLTVFRDQEFTSDLNSRSVKRIDDVRGLRGHQFPEDEGPMSHPIRPESYIEINNFYTSTVYEKGAEIIRMIHTIIGEENFQKGMKLYFERHDGDAVTTEDFLAAMSDASGEDLTLFQNWYKQNGTPRIKVTKTFANGKVKIDFEQSVNKGDKLTLHMPFKFAGINAVGEEVKADFIHLKEKKTSIDFDSKEDVALSLNRGFTTPVHIDYEYTDNELYNLMAHDSDEFSRWDATQKLYERTIFTLREANQKEQDPKSLSSFYEAFEKLLNDKKS
jgi:aminopeptidase N